MAATLPVPDGQMNVLTKLPIFLAAIVLLWPAAAENAETGQAHTAHRL